MPLATQKTKKSVTQHINAIEDEKRRKDAKILLKIFKDISGEKPVIWGDNFIVGFGNYSYKRKGGKEEFEWFKMGFAPRKDKITLYLTCDIEAEQPLLEKLGKHKHGKGCLYIKKLEDVDLNVLKELITKHKGSTWTNY